MPIMTAILKQSRRSAVCAAWFGMIACMALSNALPCAARPSLTMSTILPPVKTRTVRPVKRLRPATPTRALFRFHRDDHAPGHLTRVHINAAHAAAVPVSPLVFGNFLEHLGGAVYQGIWAQALLNPNLEQIE